MPLLSSIFLFIIVIALIGISSLSFAFSFTHNLSTSSSQKHLVCQMPSKRAKYSSKTLFFMRYSEICLVGALCAGLINKEKVGTFQIMLSCKGCLISGCALLKLDCSLFFVISACMHTKNHEMPISWKPFERD